MNTRTTKAILMSMKRSNWTVIGFILGTVVLTTWDSRASHETRSFACAARIVCGETAVGNTQTLPGDEETIVHSDSVENARTTCGTLRSTSYKTLQRVAPEGCKVASEAFQLSEERTPASKILNEHK